MANIRLRYPVYTLDQTPLLPAGTILSEKSLHSLVWANERRPYKLRTLFSETCQKPHKLACGMNGILLEQGFLGDGESPNNRVPPHRGGRRLPQKPPSLLGGSSLLNILLFR